MTPQQQMQIAMWKTQIPIQEALIEMKRAIVEARDWEEATHRVFVSYREPAKPATQVLDYVNAMEARWAAEKALLEFEIFQMVEQLKAWRKMVAEADSPIVAVTSGVPS